MKYDFLQADITDLVCVSGDFVDRLMARANGEYLKVYFYMLRHNYMDLNSEKIADALDLMQKDVERAIAYWEREGVIRQTGSVAGSFLSAPEPVQKELKQVPQEIPEKTAAKREGALVPEEKSAPVPPKEEPQGIQTNLIELPDKSQVDLRKLKDSEEFQDLTYVVQTYLSKVFTPTDMETLAYLYDVLKMPSYLIEYLVEISVQRGKRSLRYIETVALDWHKRGIDTIEQAKEENMHFTSEIWAVMKAFGISGRNPAPMESDYIKKWYTTYGFSKELILEAVNRTMGTINTPSFKYADSILTKWKGANVKTMEDVKKLDAKHEDNVRKIVENKPHPGNKFHNFEQRKNDLDSMMLDKLKRKI